MNQCSSVTDTPSAFPLLGTPQPLLIKHLLDRPLSWVPEQKIIYRDLKEFTYLEFYQRVQRLAVVLSALGVRPGDRVGVMDWDSHRYLELFFAVPMMGAVLHTVNVRLSPDQLLYSIQHAGSKVLLVHSDFLPMLEPLISQLKSVRSLIRLEDHPPTHASSLEFAGEYEALLGGAEPRFAFPDFDENTVATLFYTTGTTGQPKGVFFSHRQLILHTLSVGLTLTAFRQPCGVDSKDVYMPLTPMFHVHGWGVPYVAVALGMKQVYPGRYEPTTLLHLIARHRVTLSHCVPTVLQSLLHHPASHDVDLSGWKLMIGGSALMPALAKQARDRGIGIMAGFGLSETCPVVAVADLKPSLEGGDADARLDVGIRAGFPVPLARVTIKGSNGDLLPPGKEHTGEVLIQAPWLTRGYYRDPEASARLWEGGWLHTGDIGYVDTDGYVRITDRLKDVIKISGEWISSLELESALSQHPGVKEVAVVGVPDMRWDEHPLAEVVLRDGWKEKLTAKELARFLHGFIDGGHIHKRAILTEIRFVDQLPRTSVGKVDKKAIRELRR